MHKMMEDINTFLKKKDDLLKTMFSKEFRRRYQYYCLFGQYLDELSQRENYDDLFRKSEPELEIFPRLRYLEKETEKENAREGGVHALYNFNDDFSVCEPTRIEIVSKQRAVDIDLGLALKKNGIKAKTIADIEFIERVPMHQESRSNLQDMIMEYYNEPGIDRSFIEESIKDLRMMQEVEKLHLMFAVGERIIPVYIGIGSNQPYKLSEKTKKGKNRYYRLDLQGKNYLEQTSELKLHNIPKNELEYLVRNCDFGYGDPQADGTTISTGLLTGRRNNNLLIDNEGHQFGEWDEERYKGSFQIESDGRMKRIELFQGTREGNTEERIGQMVAEGKTGTRTVEEHLLGLFPEFERYGQVFYDPFRIIHSIGMDKAIVHLAKMGLLDSGYLNIQNVASDLYINGFPAEKRMRGIALLAMNYIRHGKLDELIENTAQGKYTKPL